MNAFAKKDSLCSYKDKVTFEVNKQPIPFTIFSYVRTTILSITQAANLLINIFIVFIKQALQLDMIYCKKETVDHYR